MRISDWSSDVCSSDLALSIAAIGSFAAGTFATFLIAVVALPLTAIALRFGSAEYLSLILLGLVTSTALAHGSAVKAMAMIVAGILFGQIGSASCRGRVCTFG